jgi:hypothetical protein
MDYGLWTTDYGLRTMDYGLWTTDYGLRTMDYGLRTPGSSEVLGSPGKSWEVLYSLYIEG